MFSYDVYTVHITDTLLRPNKEFLSILVNFDERYGMYFYTLFYANPLITLPRADKEVLINLAYYNLKPVLLDFLTLSEPAKSINENVDDIY